MRRSDLRSPVRSDPHVLQLLVLALSAIACGAPSSHAAAPAEKPASWTLDGPLGDRPARTTDAAPLSDQENRGGWKRFAPLSDEFEGSSLDRTKWWPRNPTWLGRQPALFHPGNVEVRDGMLHLTMRKQEVAEMPRGKGYHTWTSAAVQSRRVVKYGYFEARCRPMRSHGSSAFWFYRSEKKRWTEIDVFEIGGGAPGFETKYHMNLHVFHTPDEKRHWSTPSVWHAPRPLADGFRVYGLEWDRETIRFWVDGVLVRKVANTHWHQALTLNFDSETMPKWFGLPRDADLPSTFSVDYIRVWRKESVRSYEEIAQPILERTRKMFEGKRGLLEHSLRVQRYAEEILEAEGGDPLVVRAAALLHDVGIPRAREVHGSSAGKYQEIEGPPIAERILAELDVPAETIDLVAGIVANHHSATDPDVTSHGEFRIVWDADWLVNFPGSHRGATRDRIEKDIATTFRTEAGRKIAHRLFLGAEQASDSGSPE